MKILALEFSSDQRSVAVVQAGDRSDGTRAAGKSRTSETCRSEIELNEVVATGTAAPTGLAMVEEALRAARLEREQIECLAVGLGPGSYTGIRAAIALAQGWHLATGARLLGISSADCLAAEAQARGWPGLVDVVIDAQRNEFYLARYEILEKGRRERAGLRLASVDEVRECERTGALLIGPDVFPRFSGGRVVYPRAGVLGKLALQRRDFVAGDKLKPIYLRETDFAKAPPSRLPP